MSELELIYKFLKEYEEYDAFVFKANGEYVAAIAASKDPDEMELLEYYGLTISDAIRKFYEAIEEKESGSNASA